MQFHHAVVKVPRNSCGFVRSSQIRKHGERKWCQKECAWSLTLLSSCEPFFFFWCAQGCPMHTSLFLLMGVCKAPSNLVLLHFFWDAGDRKKNNQFHESLHARLYLHNLSISFHFPLPLKTKLTEAQSFDQSIPISCFEKIQRYGEVMRMI